MEDEQVKVLREKAGAFDYDGRPDIACDYEQAADAIEDLSKRVDESIPKDDAEIIIAEVAKPRWIPVTERLPFAESGDVSEKVLVTDGQDMAIAEWFNFEMCEPYWSYTGMGDITHWIPLPQPPEEE